VLLSRRKIKTLGFVLEIFGGVGGEERVAARTSGAHENRLGWRCDRAFPFPFCFFLFSFMYMSNRVEMERDSKFVVTIMCFLIKIIFIFY
jgi:hypothetical protein